MVFNASGLNYSNFQPELESQEYAACNFQLNSKKVIFRLAKITPKKVGHFASIWKRNKKRVTQPFELSDDIDYFLIATRQQDYFGLFIFSKFVLHEHKILSDKTRDGKRGFRVYPPWDLTTNKQARKTQQWQIKYFLELPIEKSIDIEKAKLLFNIES